MSERRHPRLATNPAALPPDLPLVTRERGAGLRIVVPSAPPELGEPLATPNELMYATGGAAHFHHLRDAISHSDAWQEVEGNPWPVAVIESDAANGYVQLSPPMLDGVTAMPSAEIATFAQVMWQQVSDHTILNGDAYDILAIKTVENNGKPFVIEIDEALRMRGMKPKKGGAGRRGGYEPEQRRDMYRAFRSVANVRLTVTVAGHEASAKGTRRPVVREYAGRAYTLNDTAANVMLDGSRDVRAVFVAPGLAHGLHLLGPGRQVALISAAILSLDPYREAPESFLGKYLTWQWKSQARRAGYARPYRVKTLLKNCHLALDTTRPHRTRARLEKTLHKLQAIGALAGWRYESWNLGDARARRWAPEWLEATIIVEPPTAIVEHYAPLQTHSEPAALPASQSAPLPERLRETRARLKLTQETAAEACDLAQQTYSRAERGAGVSAANRRKLEAWLATNELPRE